MSPIMLSSLLQDNWEKIVKTWDDGFLLPESLVLMSVSTLQFCSDEKANEVEEFFASRTEPSFDRTLKQSLERLRISARWVQSIKKEKSLGEVAKELTHRKY
ncbi:hypothetical protein MRB53_026228 [Persea americana]|uniref:Uncharacterized protein n=1 Tax=Persea americana TaxID=3435 RepID=A0ACC2LHE3_PERAE|nr:hypothetical protein MRB53_026228 [Persea americana]